MQVFLTGATGYIGSAVARKLRQAGHAVVGLARNEAAADRLREQGVEPFPGDLREPARLAEAARRADAVVHTAFVHDQGSFADAVAADRAAVAALADALAGSGKPFVATSGSGLLGETGPSPVDESRAIDPSFPLAVRAGAERDVLRAANRGVRADVLRLPLFVYGHGGSVFLPWLIRQARQAGVSRYIGAGDNQASAVHVEDAADLYLLALEKAPAGTLYHGAAEHGVRARDVAGAVGRLVGCPAQSITREQALQLWGPVMVAFLSINNQLDSSKAVRELGWQPDARRRLLDDLEHGSYRGGA
jgi:nucleoside-diphosphate-sugar epimerase